MKQITRIGSRETEYSINEKELTQILAQHFEKITHKHATHITYHYDMGEFSVKIIAKED